MNEEKDLCEKDIMNKEKEYFFKDASYWNDYKISEYKDKKRKLEFKYFDKKTFEKIFQEENTVEIIGDVNLSKDYDEDKEDSIGKLIIPTRTNKNQKEFNVLFNKKDKNDENCEELKKKNVQGYIWVGDNNYVRMISGFPIIILLFFGIALFLLLLAIGLRGCGTGNGSSIISPTPTPELLPVDDSANEWDGELEHGEVTKAKQESIEIPGYANLYANSEKQNINLINPEGNTVYFKYTISNEEEVLFETNLIEPNKMVEWNAFQALESGEYQLTFSIACFDLETQAGCNGANQVVKIKIK